jgi:hypothetical protein
MLYLLSKMDRNKCWTYLHLNIHPNLEYTSVSISVSVLVIIHSCFIILFINLQNSLKLHQFVNSEVPETPQVDIKKSIG